MYIGGLFIAYSLFNSTIHKKRQNGNPQNLNQYEHDKETKKGPGGYWQISEELRVVR